LRLEAETASRCARLSTTVEPGQLVKMSSGSMTLKIRFGTSTSFRFGSLARAIVVKAC
jgi:hypothetical protein